MVRLSIDNMGVSYRVRHIHYNRLLPLLVCVLVSVEPGTVLLT